MPEPNPVQPTAKTILLVEDNPSVLLLMEKALAREEGYTVLTAANGEEALEVAAGRGGEIDLLVADLVLPRVGGLELAWRLWESDPGLRIILVSGYAAEEAALSSIAADRVLFLEKPFSAPTFRAKVREALDLPESGSNR